MDGAVAGRSGGRKRPVKGRAGGLTIIHPHLRIRAAMWKPLTDESWRDRRTFSGRSYGHGPRRGLLFSFLGAGDHRAPGVALHGARAAARYAARRLRAGTDCASGGDRRVVAAPTGSTPATMRPCLPEIVASWQPRPEGVMGAPPEGPPAPAPGDDACLRQPVPAGFAPPASSGWRSVSAWWRPAAPSMRDCTT